MNEIRILDACCGSFQNFGSNEVINILEIEYLSYEEVEK